MGIFSSLFSGGSSEPSGRKTIASDTGAFTTGSEEILMPLLQVAFTPPAGWSPFTSIIKEQKPTDVRIANPSLMGSAGMITGLLYPVDGMSLGDRVDQFVAKSNHQVIERSLKRTVDGLEITFLHLAGKVSGKETVRHTIFCYFLNGLGQAVSLHCVGSTEADALTTAGSFLRTLRLVPAGG